MQFAMSFKIVQKKSLENVCKSPAVETWFLKLNLFVKSQKHKLRKLTRLNKMVFLTI